MLVLVSGGIAAYAKNQSVSAANASAPAQVALVPDTTNSTSSSTTTSTSTQTTSSSSTVTSTVTVTTTASSTTTTPPAPLCQSPSATEVGRLVLPITAAGATSTGSISFPISKGCIAYITSVGGIFNVQIVLRYAKPVTQYNVVLVANSTGYTLGSMVTGPDGSGQMQNQVLLKPGTYVVSLQILDTSSNPGQSTLVLQTAQGTIVSPPFPTPNSAQQPNQHGDSDGDK